MNRKKTRWYHTALTGSAIAFFGVMISQGIMTVSGAASSSIWSRVLEFTFTIMFALTINYKYGRSILKAVKNIL